MSSYMANFFRRLSFLSIQWKIGRNSSIWPVKWWLITLTIHSIKLWSVLLLERLLQFMMTKTKVGSERKSLIFCKMKMSKSSVSIMEPSLKHIIQNCVGYRPNFLLNLAYVYVLISSRFELFPFKFTINNFLCRYLHLPMTTRKFSITIYIDSYQSGKKRILIYY